MRRLLLISLLTFSLSLPAPIQRREPTCAETFEHFLHELAKAQTEIGHSFQDLKSRLPDALYNFGTSRNSKGGEVSPVSPDGFPAILETGEPRAKITVKAYKDFSLVRVNGVVVTGGGDPRTLRKFAVGKDVKQDELFKAALYDLNLNEADLAKMKTVPVLSVAEGFGPLVPTLAQQGFAIRGLDTWYHNEGLKENPTQSKVLGKMQEFDSQWGDKLIAGSVFNIPVANESLGVVLARRLLNNLSVRDNLRAIDEMVRVIQVGGEIRIYGAEIRADELKMHLKKRYGDKVVVEDQYTVFGSIAQYYKIVKTAPL